MTSPRNASANVNQEQSLTPVLRAAHSVWLRDTNRFLLPIVLSEAPFWERWTAVRYLADQFLAQYHRERALLEEVGPFLTPDVADRLNQDGNRIAELQGELDDIGRRRGTAHRASTAGRQLIDAVRVWCTDLEEAAGPIPLDVLAPEGRRLITELDSYARIHA